jgi:uncharacterized phage protein gp47/JayE
MADFIDFLPLSNESIDSIRARIDADINAGLVPTDPTYLDLTEGGFAWDLTQAPALEIERLWDFLASEVPAAAFVTFAWGDYLDLHGEVLNVERKDAAQATGTVTFTGEDDTAVPTGTQVAVPQATPDSDPIIFETIESGTITDGTVDLTVRAIEAGTTGNVAASAISLLMTPIDDVESVTNADATRGGFDVEDDDSYRSRLLLEYSAAQGSGTIADYKRYCLSNSGVGFVTVEPNTKWDGSDSGGYVRVTITDPNNDPVTETVLQEVQDLLDPPEHKTTASVAFNVASDATLTVESTAGFASSGTLRWRDQEIDYTGVTATTFTGCSSSGSGTVAVGDRIWQGGASGNGLAPIGHNVYVQTVSVVTIDVDATVTYETGYSADGTGGTAALQSLIESAIRSYVDTLDPGEDVVLARVEAQFFRVLGVYDVSGVQLNSTSANVTIGANQVAQTGTVTLS